MNKLLFAVSAALTICMGCGSKGGDTARSSATKPEDANSPKQYTYKIKAVYPHSTSAYTQGLIWQDSVIIESIGNYGESKLRRVDLKTGKELHAEKLTKEFFGEGVAQIGNKIYQLTWQEGKVFVYDAKSLKQTAEFTISGEGWGLTTDGKQLYLSDGSDAIYVVDPETFERKRVMNVSTNSNSVSLINEMEWIDGEIWANVYMSDFIVKINPKNGNVTGVINLDGLLPQSDITPDTDVLNGIAYDSISKKVYVTGKNWNKLFEIEITEK